MAAQLFAGRWTARMEDDFVVFLIGMRVNRVTALRRWLPVFTAMPRMLRHLERDPASGLLAYHLALAGPRSPIVVQYWRSFEDLERFARDRDAPHLRAWRDFNRLVGYDDADVGIWHETYRVTAGGYEAIYGNMPRIGLAGAGGHEPLGSTSTAGGRMRASA
jgi:Domain of unknown function (DUF4188)